MSSMRFPSREEVEKVRNEYPKGCRVVLERMDDMQAPPIGTEGTVRGVDDTGSIMVNGITEQSSCSLWGRPMQKNLGGRYGADNNHLLREKGYMAVKGGGTSLLPESDGRFGRKRAGEICHHIYTALSGND